MGWEECRGAQAGDRAGAALVGLAVHMMTGAAFGLVFATSRHGAITSGVGVAYTDRRSHLMPQRAWSQKRERQYEHIKEGVLDRGEAEETAEEIAARTVNKARARAGEAKAASRSSIEDISSSRRGRTALALGTGWSNP